MSSSTSFPLFNLPYVVLRTIFDQWTLGEIFKISLCSMRSCGIAQLVNKPGKHIALQVNGGNMLSVERGSEMLIVEVREGAVPVNQLCGIEWIYKPFLGDEPVVVTFWENEELGLKEIVKYICRVFRCQIRSVVLGCDTKWVVDWVSTQQNSIESLVVDEESDLSYALSRLEVNDSLVFTGEFPEAGIEKPTTLRRLEVELSMSLEHLLAFDCSEAHLQSSKFTNKDLNQFMKHWIEGGCSTLQELFIESKEVLDYEALLDGIEFIDVDNSEEPKVYNPKCSVCPVEVGKGFEIRRTSDGKTATLVDNGPDSDQFSLIVLP